MALSSESPIDRLSDDILTLIFSRSILFVEETSEEYGSRRQQGITIEPFQLVASSVCRRWRALLVSSPLLWTRICPQVEGLDTAAKVLFPTTKLFLERSAHLPVAITLPPIRGNYPGSAYRLADHNQKAIAQLLLDEKYRTRIESLTLSGSIYDCLASTSPSIPSTSPSLPRVKHLSIILDDDELCEVSHQYGKPYLTSVGRHFPTSTLESLECRNYCFFCTPILYETFPSLTYLHMDPIMPTKLLLSTIFRSAPSLETLVLALEGSRFPFQYDTSPLTNRSTIQPIIAPQTLLRLAIFFRLPQTSICQCALPNLRIPNLEYLEIGGCLDASEPHCAAILSQLTDSPTLKKIKCHADHIAGPRWVTTRETSADWVKVFTNVISCQSKSVDVEILILQTPSWFPDTIRHNFIPTILYTPKIRSLVLRVSAGFVREHILDGDVSFGVYAKGKPTTPVVFQFVEADYEKFVECRNAVLQYVEPIVEPEGAIRVERLLNTNAGLVRGEDLLDSATVRRRHGCEWSVVNPDA